MLFYNNKEKGMKKILVILMLVFAFGCSDNGTQPDLDSIVGTWKTPVIFIDSEDKENSKIIFVLKFEENGNFQLSNELAEDVMINENGTYTVIGDTLSIINSKCEDSVGKYKFEFKDNGVEITQIADDCINNNFIDRFFYNYD